MSQAESLANQFIEMSQALHRIRQLLPKWEQESKEFQCGCYGWAMEDLEKALGSYK